jgi:hypothetical protein
MTTVIMCWQNGGVSLIAAEGGGDNNKISNQQKLIAYSGAAERT